MGVTRSEGSRIVDSSRRWLRFRCTGCGSCCREPLLPLTDGDLRRIVRATGDDPRDVVAWVTPEQIAMDDEPEAFVRLRGGPRVMVMRQGRTGCRFLGPDQRCRIYASRPQGCRVFPFDADFDRSGALRRLRLIQGADCRYALDGHNDPAAIRRRQECYGEATHRYHARVARWNAGQAVRRDAGRAPGSGPEFLRFLGFSTATGARGQLGRARSDP